jgi:hypothetical protein
MVENGLGLILQLVPYRHPPGTFLMDDPLKEPIADPSSQILKRFLPMGGSSFQITDPQSSQWDLSDGTKPSHQVLIQVRIHPPQTIIDVGYD